MHINSLVAISLGFVLFSGSSELHAEKLIFAEEFSGPVDSIIPKGWVTKTHNMGQGKLDRKPVLDGAGVAEITVDTLATEEGLFSLTEIATERTFEPKDKVLDFKIRCRIDGEDQRGLVFGYFLYNQYQHNGAMRSDELDIEFVSNLAANTKEDKLFVTAWNEWNRDQKKYFIQNDPIHGNHVDATVPLTKNIGDWHTYTMRWKQGLAEWFVEEENGTQTKIASFSGNQVPSRPMHLHVNAWVAPSDWAMAFDDALKVTKEQGEQKKFSLLIDWIRVYESDVASE